MERYSQSKMLFARLEPGPILQQLLDRLLDTVRQRDRSTSVFLADSAAWLSQVQLCLLYALSLSLSATPLGPYLAGGTRSPTRPPFLFARPFSSPALSLRPPILFARPFSSPAHSLRPPFLFARPFCSPPCSAAATVAQNVSLKGSTILLHCEDDAESVSILSALSKLCLDPYYRTLKGFQVLIEEDWLAFGFRFADRCGHLVRVALRQSRLNSAHLCQRLLCVRRWPHSSATRSSAGAT